MGVVGALDRRVYRVFWSHDEAASDTMSFVSTGKRAGSRRSAPQPRTLNKPALLIGAAAYRRRIDTMSIIVRPTTSTSSANAAKNRRRVRPRRCATSLATLNNNQAE